MHMRIYDAIIASEPIKKGWSADRKYCVTTRDGARYLLRVSSMARFDNRKALFEQLRAVSALGIPMSRPIEFGTCGDGVYSLLSWVEGSDAENEIPELSEPEQFHYGLEAGRILKKIHSLPAPAPLPEWESRFNGKIDRKIQMYRDCPIQYENGQSFIDYINENRHLLTSRPQCFQHGDYHIGNMMLDRFGTLTIIDFDRFDYGDPWEEFNRIVWCAQACPPFATGMVEGYFDGTPPMAFWRLLALYIASNTLSSVPWAIPFGQCEIDIMLHQAQEVLLWYDQMRDPVPTWYRPVSHMHVRE